MSWSKKYEAPICAANFQVESAIPAMATAVSVGASWSTEMYSMEGGGLDVRHQQANLLFRIASKNFVLFCIAKSDVVLFRITIHKYYFVSTVLYCSECSVASKSNIA